MVVIVNYNMGNIDSVKRAIEELGRKVKITESFRDLDNATHIIIPGVGAFKNGMNNLKELEYIESIKEKAVVQKKPTLGICLGMQLLSTKGFEFGETEGLNLISGVVKKLETDCNERIPHTGWNEIIIEKESEIVNGITNQTDFYFVHSYHFIPDNKQYIIAKTPYCGNIVTILQKDNIVGVQFHPEKSQKSGFKLLENFLNM